MIGLAALDFVLRRFRARVVRVTLVLDVLRVNSDARPASEFQLTRSPILNRSAIRICLASRGSAKKSCDPDFRSRGRGARRRAKPDTEPRSGPKLGPSVGPPWRPRAKLPK